MSYLTSSEVREQTHEAIEVSFAGHFYDGSSQASLSFDGDYPPKVEFKVVRKKGVDNLKLVINSHVVDIKSAGNIESDDRVLDPVGHFMPSENTMLVYKALTEAINQGKIKFKGKFDCVKKSKPGSSSRAPKVEANTLIPYIYSSWSNIKGTVEFRGMFTAGEESREVIVINVTGQGRRPDILDGTLVYLGGKGHVIDPQNPFGLKPYERGVMYVSSPFPNLSKRSVDDYGANVCVAELENGEYGYWSTGRVVESDRNVMQLGDEVFGEIEEGYDGNKDDFPFKIKNGWVLKGNRLSPNTALDISLPTKVLEIFQCGFFYTKIPFKYRGLFSFKKRVRRLLEQVHKLGANMFGLVRRDDGLHCDITTLSSVIGLSTDNLLHAMSRLQGMEEYFSGSVDFFLPEEKEVIGDPRNMFIITGPVPFSKWMSGTVVDTGVGLLFVENTMTYYEVEEVDGVGLLSVYKGPAKTSTRELNVQFIMSKKYK